MAHIFTPCEYSCQQTVKHASHNLFTLAAMDLRPIDVALAMAKKKGLTQTAFADLIGASSADVSNWKKRGMPADRHRDVAAALGISVDALLQGAQNVTSAPSMQGTRVPLISWVKAGQWHSASDPFAPGEAERWMDCPVPHSPGSYALRVRGDSMTAPHGNTRTYPEGSIIFVDSEKRTPTNGDRVIACLLGTDEVTFKVYKNEDGRQWLQPLNPSHDPIREEFKVLGTIFGKWEDG